MRFDRIAVLDWSAAGTPRLGRDSIWLGRFPGAAAENLATRHLAEARLHALIAGTLAAGRRLLIGVDVALGFPAGLAARLTGRASALAVWGWLADTLRDGPDNASNHRETAARINAIFPGDGPFWGDGRKAATPGLPRRKPALPEGLAEWRATDLAARAPGAAPKPVWQLAGAGAVGAQVLTALPVLHRLRAAFPGRVAVWPFERADTPIVIAEVYPALLAAEVRAACAADPALVPDRAQVVTLAQSLWALNAAGTLAQLFDAPAIAAPEIATEEGWILGAGQQMLLRAALPPMQQPPRLRNDAFALPQGVNWVPVDEALTRLRAALRPLTGTESLTTAKAAGRILAQPCAARRANPPQPNSAVDGYGFAHAALRGPGPFRLPLVAGRAAAGQPFADPVPPGAAIRILTGAILPGGVDTVVLEEDCATDAASVTFDGPARPRANTRRAGEDVDAGAPALPAGRRLRAPDLALLTALGVDRVTVHRRLRVGVLSTGDEILPDPALPAAPHQIYDANRPMLLALAAGWGCAPVDLGHVRDNRAAIAARLDRGARVADVILTSGGASAGDEDHVSWLLRHRGQLTSWRIAMKPGRPLAMALWNGVPVLGLPGNPVAAFVCALVFARPALSLMGGGGWILPRGMTVPAAFAKRKKAGRREYLRARLDSGGRAEVFASEGSGRISGIAWAEGIVELPDGAAEITPGTPVRYIPYADFGL